jgi:DNA-binding transcriptional ArsR family regulator
MNVELVSKVVERLRALADENRLRLLLRLREGACNVSELTQAVGIAQASVSKHLSVLRRVGLIDVTRVGTAAVYRIRDESVFEMCQIVCDGVVRHLQEEHAVLERIGEG